MRFPPPYSRPGKRQRLFAAVRFSFSGREPENWDKALARESDLFLIPSLKAAVAVSGGEILFLRQGTGELRQAVSA